MKNKASQELHTHGTSQKHTACISSSGRASRRLMRAWLYVVADGWSVAARMHVAGEILAGYQSVPRDSV